MAKVAVSSKQSAYHRAHLGVIHSAPPQEQQPSHGAVVIAMFLPYIYGSVLQAGSSVMETVLTDIDSMVSPEHCIIYILVGGGRLKKSKDAESPNLSTPHLEQTGYEV